MSEDISPDAGDHLGDLLNAETEIDIDSFILDILGQFGGAHGLAVELKIQYDATPAGSPGRATILGNIVKLIHARTNADHTDDEDLEDLESEYKAVHSELGSGTTS
jgi:hypothetical protein